MKIRLGFVPIHRYPYDEDGAVRMRKRCLDATQENRLRRYRLPECGPDAQWPGTRR